MKAFVWKLLTIIAPQRVRGWVAAILNEVEYLDRREHMNWYAAAAKVSFAHRVKTLALPAQAFALATAMLVIDWTSGEMLAALTMIALSAMTIRNWYVAVAVAGGTLPAAHAIANWVPVLRPAYQYASLDFRDWMILAAVAAIGLCAVQVAHFIRRTLTYTR